MLTIRAVDDPFDIVTNISDLLVISVRLLVLDLARVVLETIDYLVPRLLVKLLRIALHSGVSRVVVAGFGALSFFLVQHSGLTCTMCRLAFIHSLLLVPWLRQIT